MSATHSNKKRKLDSGRISKRKRLPSKKSRQSNYDSDDDDETEVTARDAPRPDVEPADISSTRRGEVSSGANSEKVSERRSISKKRQRSPHEDVSRHASNSMEGSDEEEENTGNVDAGDDTNSSASEDDSDDSEDSQTGSTARSKTKRNDPSAFATSISAILGSSLSRNKRVDPVLSRSKEAAEASKALVESKLDTKARKQLVAERRLAKEKGRVRDVLIGDRKATIGEDHGTSTQSTGPSAAEILAKEKQLRKLAQRGVVKLFNAVRAAQVRGEEEARRAKADGVIGIDSREEKVKNMSKNAFLDLVGAGGERR